MEVAKEMKKARLIKVLTALSVIAIPLFELHQNAYANANSAESKVIAYKLNVREDSDNSSKIIGLLHRGEKVEIIQEKNDWDEIKLSNKQTGWVFNAYLASPESTGAAVDAQVLNVRENPSLLSSVVGRLKIGVKITIKDEKAGWAKIVSSSGVHGWVYEKYITKDKHSSIVTPTTKTKTTKETVHKATAVSPSSQPPLSSNGNMTEQSITEPIQKNKQLPLKGKIIVLDPGHGGKDDGTTGIDGVHEKSLTLPTALVVKQKLESAGANVIMTRLDDTYVPLLQRADISNQNHADAFISMHYNWSSDPSVNGATDFYYQKSSNPLASDIIKEVVKTTGLNNDGTRLDNLSVLRNNTRPSILIELGFLSNQNEESVIESAAYRDKVAQGVYQGLLDYFQSNNK